MEEYVEDFICSRKEEEKKNSQTGGLGESLIFIYLVIQNTYRSLDLHS